MQSLHTKRYLKTLHPIIFSNLYKCYDSCAMRLQSTAVYIINRSWFSRQLDVLISENITYDIIISKQWNSMHGISYLTTFLRLAEISDSFGNCCANHIPMHASENVPIILRIVWNNQVFNITGCTVCIWKEPPNFSRRPD